MAGFLDKLRKNVVSSVWKDTPERIGRGEIDDKIALGVLLWVVAEADERFLPEEKEKIKEILKNYCEVPEGELPAVLAAIEEAAKERVDLYQFSSEVSEGLSYAARRLIIEQLFRVACADQDLDNDELEAIRKVSSLFHLSHKDFIDAKIKVKKEFGLA